MRYGIIRENYLLWRAATILLCLLGAGCGTGVPHEPLTNNKAGLRIISLAPSITEMLFEMGLSDNIIGVTSYCNYPPEARRKEVVGSFSQPNIERIITLKPDLILTTGLEQDPIADKLKTLGYKIEVINPNNMEELFSAIRHIGSLARAGEQAGALIRNMQDRLKRIEDKVERIPKENRKNVFIEIWYEPIMTAGPGSFVDELVMLAGGVNIAHDAPRQYSRFSPELVIRRNPDVIILGYMDRQGRWAQALKQRAGWGDIKAVKDNRVFDDLDPDLFLRPGPRSVIGIEEIYKRLYGADQVRESNGVLKNYGKQ